MASTTQKVPPRFVELHDDDLGDAVSLIDPVGKTCNIELRIINGELCFGKDWNQFLSKQHISSRSLLLFKCLGNSKMKIRVFDVSATEIKYCSFQQPAPSPQGGNNGLLQANMYTTSNPSFVVSIKPSHLTPKGGANIPAKFARLHMNGVPDYVTLETTENGFKAWTMRCSYTHGKDYVNRRLCWYVFVQHAGIRWGDTCVVEMLNSDKVTFRVVVFRQ